MDKRFFFPQPDDEIVIASRAEGVYIFDENGNKYLDGSSGAMTVGLGHGNIEIIDAIKEQLDEISFTYRSQFSNLPLEELCSAIAGIAPENLDYVSLANSGSEAAELAMKMAYSYWTARGKPTKQRIISRWSSYHGSTIGALSMSGNAARRKEYSPYLSDFPILELPFCHHCPFEKEPKSCNLFCANYLQTLINRIGSENISALICEPVTGASGAGITPPQDYFPRISEICNKNDILLIMDEVITGFGRTGRYFASEHWNIEPDIIIFGKGITGGYFPLSGIITSIDIYNTVDKGDSKFSTGHTYSGNPLACACGKATIKYLKTHDIVGKVFSKGALIEEKLTELMNRQQLISDIRGKGLLWGVEFMKSRTNKEFFDARSGFTGKIVRECFENGLIVYPSTGFVDGISGDSILLSPPLTITESEIKTLMDLLEKSIERVAKNI